MEALDLDIFLFLGGGIGAVKALHYRQTYEVHFPEPCEEVVFPANISIVFLLGFFPVYEASRVNSKL